MGTRKTIQINQPHVVRQTGDGLRIALPKFGNMYFTGTPEKHDYLKAFLSRQGITDYVILPEYAGLGQAVRDYSASRAPRTHIPD